MSPSWLEGVRWIASANQSSLQRWVALPVAWAVASLLARVGIPTVDPSLMPTARPLETLGTVALCLPAGLSAAMLRDQLSWLTATSPRGAHGLRLLWLGLVAVFTNALAALWILTLPTGIPTTNVAGVWLLVLALAILSVVVLGSELAVVLPFLAMIPFSIGGLVPFGANVVYNVAREGELLAIATTVTAVAVAAFANSGAKLPG